MPAPRTSRRPYWLSRFDADGRAQAPVALDAADVPAAWRWAEREAHGTSFALYDPEGARVRVGVAPPAAMRLPSAATASALAPDGLHVLTGHEDGALRVYETRSGALVWERFVAASRIDHVAATRSTDLVLACARSGEIRVLERATGDVVLHLADDDARALALAPDERTLALAGAVVELFSLPDGARLASFEVEPRAAQVLARADGDDASPDEPDDETGYGDDGLHAVGFAHGGTHVVAARAQHGGEVIVWDRATGQRIARREGLPAERIAVLGDGLRAVLGSRHDGASVRVVDLATLETRAVCTTGAEGLFDLRVTPDDRFALVHDGETGIYVLDLATGATHAWMDELEACAYAVSARAGARGGRARAHDEDTHVVALPRWRRSEPGEPLSGDGRRYAALRHLQDEGVVALFDVAACQPYAALMHARTVESVCLDQHGARVLTRDVRGRVFVWNVPDAPVALG